MIIGYKKGKIVLRPYCSLNCLFCEGCSRATKKEIEKQEKEVYKQLQKLKEKEIEKVTIAGTDPIEYEYIIELIEYIKNNFKEVKLFTNGTRVGDSSFAKKLIAADLDKIIVPIYGSNAKIHDSITNKKGSFKKIVAAINNVSESIKVGVNTLILKNNKDDLINIVDLVDDLRVNDHSFSIPEIADSFKVDTSFYIPIKNLSFCARRLYDYVLKNNKEVYFKRIPFCVFEEFNQEIITNKKGISDLNLTDKVPY
ncbi:MAG: radical SAM protein, partial [Minisyncoccales bacterium]